VIIGACASTAGSKDSAIFAEIMDQTLENFKQNDVVCCKLPQKEYNLKI
jgi:hypothetical protein